MSRQRPSRRRRRPARPAEPTGLKRVQFVWLALLASMTTVGGLLLLVDGRPIPRLDGLSLPALASAATPDTVESVFRTRTPLDRERWTGIVIHCSGAPTGSPASISKQHEQMGFRGLGHHFIIGNGSGMEDGELYVGYRWLSQLPGAHAGGPRGDYYNRHAISICLVGDGTRQPFSDAQIRRTVQLVSALCRELDIPLDHVLLHSDIAQADDPGRLFPTDLFRAELAASR